MEKIILRKDYKVETLPVEKAAAMTLAKRAVKTWTETFVDEDTKEKIDIERNEIILERGTFLDDKHMSALKEAGIKEVTVTDGRPRAEELTTWCRIGHVKVTMRDNHGHNAVLVVRSDSMRHAMDLAADYAEGAFEQVFGDKGLCDSLYITKVEILNNIRFIGRTKEDIEKEEEALAEDKDAPKKEPFKVKATFIDAEFYDPNEKRPEGIHKGDMFVVWAYDVVTAKNIVFDYIKAQYPTIVNEHETLRVVGATQFFAHTYVPAEYCNEYILNERLKIKTEDNNK